MLMKIEDKEIMTKRAARKKYETKFFVMAITETVDKADNDLGYVMYAADDRRELNEVPQSEYEDLMVGFMIGGMAYPYPMTGKVVHYG